MNSTKCRQCGLVNLASDDVCRRCASSFNKACSSSQSGKGKAAVRTLLYTVLALVLIGGAAAYVFVGLKESYTQVGVNEANRLAKQANNQTADQTRGQFEKKQTGQYGNAIQNSNGLAQSQKHVDDVQKLMEPAKQSQPR
jgi:uncharacterized protein HemX